MDSLLGSLKSSYLQVSGTKSSQVIDVSFWVLLLMAVVTMDSSMYSVDRSAVSNIFVGFTREVDDLKVPRQSPLLQPKKARVGNLAESAVAKYFD